MESHLMFYSSCLPMFTHYNLFLQRGDPLAHKVYPVTKSLVKKIGSRFLDPSCFVEGTVTEEIIDDEENYLPLEEVFIGLLTRKKLKKLFFEGDINKTQYNLIPKAAIAFYRESLRYVLNKMDMKSSFWSHAVWIDFFNRSKAKWPDVEYFVNNFSSVLQYDSKEIDDLYSEFFDYKTLSITELPDDALTDALIAEGEDSDEYRMDIIWYHLYQMKSPVGNNFRFHNLFYVARLVLVTPHSNAGIERVYSLVNKNKNETSDRNRLDIERSLSAILAVKMDKSEAFYRCYDFKPDKNLLKEAKKATNNYNKEHCNK